MLNRARRRLWLSGVMAAVMLAGGGTAGTANGQSGPDSGGGGPLTSWTISASVGGFVRGNKDAIVGWLNRNGYGIPEPQKCGFDVLFRTKCSDAIPYPDIARAQLIAGVLGGRGNIAGPFSIELLVATEQSGDITGRCDDQAVPANPHCTTRFVHIDFEGSSVASLAVWTRRGTHIGVGPAFLLATWHQDPRRVPGVWLDASFSREGTPIIARAQLRYYGTTNVAPDLRLTGFHPSTLFLGLGMAGTTTGERTP